MDFKAKAEVKWNPNTWKKEQSFRKNEYMELKMESLKREIAMTEQQAEKIARLEHSLNQ